MSILETIDVELDSTESWTERGGVFWLPVEPGKLRRLAVLMNECRARFVTITATQLPGTEGLLLEYLWDYEGRLLGFSIRLRGNSIESIFDLCPAVDWIEREVHEGFSVEFTGREYEPLLLRAGDKTGVNLREVPA